MPRPRRIAIVGNSGSGKSQLAVQIGDALKLPVIHLDRYFWLPGWVQRDRDAFDALHEDFVAGNAWVIDGNFARTVARRAVAADLVIFFDLPVWLCLWRIGKRVLTSLRTVRPDMAPGCPERIDLGFIKYVWAWRRRRRAETLDALVASRHKIVAVRRKSDLAAVWQTLGVSPPGR